MRYSNFIERPADYSKAPEVCAFRYCTEEAVTQLMVPLADIDTENEQAELVTIPVCPQHRDVVEKARNKKGAR